MSYRVSDLTLSFVILCGLFLYIVYILRGSILLQMLVCVSDSVVVWVGTLSCGLVNCSFKGHSVLFSKPWVWPSNSFGIQMFKSYLSWFLQAFFLFFL